MAREPPHKMSAANKRLASFAHRKHEPLTQLSNAFAVTPQRPSLNSIDRPA